MGYQWWALMSSGCLKNSSSTAIPVTEWCTQQCGKTNQSRSKCIILCSLLALGKKNCMWSKTFPLGSLFWIPNKISSCLTAEKKNQAWVGHSNWENFHYYRKTEREKKQWGRGPNLGSTKTMKKERQASGRCIEQAQLNQRTASYCEKPQSKSRKWRSMKLAVHETAEQH